MNKEKLILVGGGSHCNACIDVIEVEGLFEIEGIVDLKENVGKRVLGYPIIAEYGSLNQLMNTYRNFIVTIGQIKSPEWRIEQFNFLKNAGVNLPMIKSPRAYVSKHASIGEGTIIMHDVLVSSNVKIGKNCIINTKALLEHDSCVGDHCHISTAAVINGASVIEDESFIGSNAVIKESITIPKRAIIPAGMFVKR